MTTPPQKQTLRYEMVAANERKEMNRIFIWAITLELVLLAFVGLMGLSLRVFSPSEDVAQAIQEYFPQVVGIVVFLILIKLILDILRLSILRTVRKYRGMESSGLMVWRVVSYTIWLVVFVFILMTFVGGAWTYMVWVGVIIAAIIYALASPLQNIAAWFLIATSQPFKIGDIVELGGTRGYVVDVTLSSTVLREMGNWVGGDLFTGRVINIPNKSIFETGVSNYTKFNDFIYDYLTVSITYESDLQKAEEMLLEATNSVIRMDDEVIKAVHAVETAGIMRMMPKEPKVFWNFRDSAILFGVLYPVSMRRRFYTKSEITKKYMNMIKSEPSLSIAYPHMELVRHEFTKDGGRKEVA